MFSVPEKQKIASAIEKLLLSFNHPEMPKERPSFRIHIDGKESWSWAYIDPNWKYPQKNKPKGIIGECGGPELSQETIDKIKDGEYQEVDITTKE